MTWIGRDGINNEKLYKEYQLLSLHGQDKDAHAKFGSGGWEYDIIYTGYKCNMTDLTAAFGLKQLERFPNLIKKRSEIYQIYNEKLCGLGIECMLHKGFDFQGNYHLYLTRVPGMTQRQRNEIMAKMNNEFGIACNVHFKPLPMMTAYNKLGFDIKNYPHAYAQYANEITLPMHTLLTGKDAEYIATMYIQAIYDTKVFNGR